MPETPHHPAIPIYCLVLHTYQIWNRKDMHDVFLLSHGHRTLCAYSMLKSKNNKKGVQPCLMYIGTVSLI